MLIHSTWILSPSETAVLPRTYHLELVKELHRRMNIEMGGDEIPAVTFSALVGYYSSSKDFLTFYPNEFYTLSLCGLNETAGKAIANLDLSPVLEFLGTKFEVSDRQDEITSYEQLYTQLVANEPEPIRQFNLKFITPTAFSQNRTHVPLPVPALMFGSWLKRWNQLAPVYLGSEELIAYLNNEIAIRRHNIQTRNFQLDRAFITGLVGRVQLQMFHRTDPLLANVAHLLVRYAEFTGTGVKTRLGMGQTQIELDR